jgi:hypothetical protein
MAASFLLGELTPCGAVLIRLRYSPASTEPERGNVGARVTHDQPERFAVGGKRSVGRDSWPWSHGLSTTSSWTSVEDVRRVLDFIDRQEKVNIHPSLA